MYPFEGFVSTPPTIEAQVPQLPLATADVVQEVLDVKEVRSRRGNPYRRILVKWLGKPAGDSTWITEAELKRVDPAIYEEFVKAYSSEPSLFSTRGD